MLERVQSRRSLTVLGVVVAVSAGLTFGVIRMTGQATQGHKLPQGLTLLPRSTTDRPLIAPGAHQVQLKDAPTELGAPIALPDTGLVGSVRSVWAVTRHDPDTGEGDSEVAITFPKRPLIIDYRRPAPPNPIENYKGLANEHANTHTIDLNGVPGLAITQKSDQLSSNMGVVSFIIDGVSIDVRGYYDETVLRQIALSILDRAATSTATN